MEYMVLQIGNEAYKNKGESLLNGYKGDIELMSFSWGVSNPIQASSSNTGRSVGRPNFAEMTVTKKMDATSPLFAFSCAAAEDLGEVKVVILRQDTAKGADVNTNLAYMTYTFKDTLVSSVSVGGGGDIPVETLSLNYSQVEWHYEPQKVSMGDESEKKTIKAWDLSENKAAAGGGDAAA